MAEPVKHKVSDYLYIDKNYPFMTVVQMAEHLDWFPDQVKSYCRRQGYNPKPTKERIRRHQPSFKRARGVVSTQESIFQKYGV